MVLRKLWFVISKIFCGCQLFRNYNNGIPLHIEGAQPSTARKISTTITLRKALNSSWLFILSTCITVLNHLMLHIKVKQDNIFCYILFSVQWSVRYIFSGGLFYLIIAVTASWWEFFFASIDAIYVVIIIVIFIVIVFIIEIALNIKVIIWVLLRTFEGLSDDFHAGQDVTRHLTFASHHTAHDLKPGL